MGTCPIQTPRLMPPGSRAFPRDTDQRSMSLGQGAGRRGREAEKAAEFKALGSEIYLSEYESVREGIDWGWLSL